MSHSFSEALAGGNFSNGKAGFAAGTTTTVTTAAFTYTIEGRQYNKAAASNAATPTLDAATLKPFIPVAPGKACNFVGGVNAAGLVEFWQGPITNAGQPADFPSLPFTHAPFGYVRVESAGPNAWTFGASNMAGVAGVTHSFRDISGLPARPTV